MERMAVISRDDYDLPLLSLSGWRPGPPTPYPLVPAARRFEWLAFVATPFGGTLAVVDYSSAGGICMALALIAVVIFAVPMAIRELIYRLPRRVSLILQFGILGLYGFYVALCVGLIIWVTPLGATEMAGMGVVAFGLWKLFACVLDFIDGRWA